MEELNSLQGELHKLQKEESDKYETETLQDVLPSLFKGPSLNFPFASSALELRYYQIISNYFINNEGNSVASGFIFQVYRKSR